MFYAISLGHDSRIQKLFRLPALRTTFLLKPTFRPSAVDPTPILAPFRNNQYAIFPPSFHRSRIFSKPTKSINCVRCSVVMYREFETQGRGSCGNKPVSLCVFLNAARPPKDHEQRGKEDRRRRACYTHNVSFALHQLYKSKSNQDILSIASHLGQKDPERS